MAVEAHITELRQKHKSLDHKIEQERSRPLVDNIKLSELKKKKLQLKEEIARLQTDLKEMVS